MLSITTQRHGVFVCIPGLQGDSNSRFGGYSESIDDAVDGLLTKCQQDASLPAALQGCATRAEAYQLIAVHLDKPLRSQRIASDLCRRVLYLLEPNRFGFEKYGWIQ